MMKIKLSPLGSAGLLKLLKTLIASHFCYARGMPCSALSFRNISLVAMVAMWQDWGRMVSMGENEDYGIQETQDCRTSCLVCLSLNFLILKTKNDDNTYLGRLP